MPAYDPAPLARPQDNDPLTRRAAAPANGSDLPAGPVPFDPTTPATARVYNAMLGGKDNFGPDRRAAMQIMRLSPAAAMAAADNRAFLARAVYLAAQAGADQFIDIGSGMPAAPNTHDVAALSGRPSRTVYVDNDPVVVNHAIALLVPDGNVMAMAGDLRDPRAILENPELRWFVDLDKPVTVVLGAVLHFLPDDDAYAAVDCLKEAMAPGSTLIISHATADDASADQVGKVLALYRETGTPLYLRTGDEVERFFTGLDLVRPPGVTDVNAWRPDPDPETPGVTDVIAWRPEPAGPTQTIGYGGAGTKPCPPPDEGHGDEASPSG